MSDEEAEVPKLQTGVNDVEIEHDLEPDTAIARELPEYAAMDPTALESRLEQLDRILAVGIAAMVNTNSPENQNQNVIESEVELVMGHVDVLITLARFGASEAYLDVANEAIGQARNKTSSMLDKTVTQFPSF